jgi:hypothetical protein
MGLGSVFSLATPASPSLGAEIPVGIEPVSVNPWTDDEVWVLNEAARPRPDLWWSRTNKIS